MGLALRKSAPVRTSGAPQKSTTQRPGSRARPSQLPADLLPEEILYLQTAAGNAAVVELIDERRTATSTATAAQSPAAEAAATPAAGGGTGETAALPGSAPGAATESAAAPGTAAASGTAQNAITAGAPGESVNV